jgi:hypothetical protein
MLATRSNQPIEYISPRDKALDVDSPAFNFSKFMETFDRQYMPIKPGMTPTVFTLKKLTRKLWNGITSQPAHVQNEAAVTFCVTGISNCTDSRGNLIVPEFEGQDAERRLSQKTLDDIWTPNMFPELGKVILVISDLSPL